YAHQDKEDDAKLGLKSTALTFGDNTKPVLYGCTAAFLAGLAGTGLSEGLHPAYYVGVTGAASHLLWQIRTADLDDPDNLAVRFKSNQWTGLAVLASVVAGRLCG
ncbi:hypothetical protein TeGR_g14389, partial [Tetraparma gracilis]